VESFYQNPDVLGKVRAWQVCFNNVMLFGLYNQLSAMAPEEKMKHDPNGKRVSTFFYNAWSAIDDLEVFLRPRLRNVQALISAVSESGVSHGWPQTELLVRRCALLRYQDQVYLCRIAALRENRRLLFPRSLLVASLTSRSHRPSDWSPPQQ
jgi:hypothetical protein